MSGRETPSRIRTGPVRGHLQHHWQSRWKSLRRLGSQPTPERPLNQYEWRTSTRQPTPGNQLDQTHDGQTGPGPLPRIIRSLSEPGPAEPESSRRTGLTFSGLVSLMSRRISRVLRDDANVEEGGPGRRAHLPCLCVCKLQTRHLKTWQLQPTPSNLHHHAVSCCRELYFLFTLWSFIWLFYKKTSSSTTKLLTEACRPRHVLSASGSSRSSAVHPVLHHEWFLLRPSHHL